MPGNVKVAVEGTGAETRTRGPKSRMGRTRIKGVVIHKDGAMCISLTASTREDQ